MLPAVYSDQPYRLPILLLYSEVQPRLCCMHEIRLPDLNDFACKFMSRYQGKPCTRMKITIENMLITTANAGIFYFNQHLCRCDLRRGHSVPFYSAILFKN